MAELLPITRERLQKCYSKHPVAPIPEDAKRIEAELSKAINEIAAAATPAVVELKAKLLLEKPPHKVDENIFCNRCQLEEIGLLADTKAAALGGAERAKAVKSLVEEGLGHWTGYQKSSMESVEALVKTFLPNDFRLSIFNSYRARSEANSKAAVDALVANGGSIQERYDLLWKQEFDRRQSLVNLGNASGIWRFLISVLAGVPTALLDFVKTVNDEKGPMDEFRATYGPHIYFMSLFANKTRVLAALLAAAASSDGDEGGSGNSAHSALVEEALRAYVGIAGDYTGVLAVVLKDSPFFVTREQADIANAESGQEVKVLVKTDHKIEVPVGEGDVFSWEFRTNKDIKFQAKFTPAKECADKNEAAEIHPLMLVNSHLAPVQDEFTAPCAGLMTLFFDNSYSRLSNKDLTIKTKITPNPELVKKEFEADLKHEEEEKEKTKKAEDEKAEEKTQQ